MKNLQSIFKYHCLRKRFKKLKDLRDYEKFKKYF